MGTLFSKSPSQGSATGVLGKLPQTPGDLIVYCLEDLKGCDFKRFRNKLSDFYNEDKLPIPQEKLENADWITTKELLIVTYGDEGALDVTIDVLSLIGLMVPANDLQERREQNAKLKKMTHDNRSDFRKEYRKSAKQKFQRIKHYNSHMGESVHLQKRFTTLLMRKGPQNKKRKEYEIRGRIHLKIVEKGQDKYSPTTIQTLFDPDENGFNPTIVVLEGPAGIGKTMTSKKIMLDWASGNPYYDKFDFVFYLNCREINNISGTISLVGLLSIACKLSSDDLVSILKDPGSQRKLLTIVDGFDQLRWTLEEESEVCLDISMETHKEIILRRLLSKQVLPQSSLIITTRSLAMEKLNTFIHDSRNVEIQGFTREDREEYIHKFFGKKEDADKVVSIIKENEVLYTMCAVPVICWVVCTAMKQEIRKDLSLIQCITVTSIYLLYLEVLLTHHSKEQSVHRKQTCLKKLCALANQGVLNKQILFEEKDIERHGLSLSEVESVFLNENIFRREVHTHTRYSFIHLSVQEFLAALYYVLDDGFGFMKGAFLPEICIGKSSCHFASGFIHLALAVQFLFGLLHEKSVKIFSESTGINISLRARPAMMKWAEKDIKQTFYFRTISCLYETQDEDFIRRVMSNCSSLELHGSGTAHFWMNRNYCKQLRYCLKTLKRENIQSLNIHSLTVSPECQKILSPLLHRSQKVKFWGCIILSKDCPGEDKAEYEDSDTLSFLMNPESKIQELWLEGCGVTSSCCDDLRSILINNRSLTRLDLLYNNLQDSGMKLLCEGLRHPGCTLQWLNVTGCMGTLSCCDDLCSVFPTNQTLTRLWMNLIGDEKISDSEKDRCCEVLRNAGFTVERGIRSFWIVSMNRRK